MSQKKPDVIEETVEQEIPTQPEESEMADPAPKSELPEEEDLTNRYLRLAADFQNFRKRTEKEKNDIYAYANEKLITELLAIIDNFERALSFGAGETGLQEGMAMVLKQLLTALERSGLEEIKAQGEAFDPNFHHAVIAESQEGTESGIVLEVLQKGYLLNKKLIRPAMVKVAE